VTGIGREDPERIGFAPPEVGRESRWGMTVWPVARQFRQPDGNNPAPGAERRIAWVAALAAPHRFNPAAIGRIVGFVAAQRTHEQGLAAFGPDGTIVQKLPAIVVGGAAVRTPRPGARVPGNRRVTR
jgi:hypothetical protein